MTEADARRLSAGLAAMCREQPSWRALALVGSWARDAARSDSDLDLLVLTTSLTTWAGDGEWLRGALDRLGYRLRSLELEFHGVARSWRAHIEPDLELEVTFAGLSWAEAAPLDPGTRRVVSDGLQPLVDKDGLLASVRDTVQRGLG